MVLLTYLVNFGIFLAFMINFVGTHRCAIREAGRNYDSYVGLEFTATFSEQVMCYSHWMFASWLVVFIFAAIGLAMYLRSLDAAPSKVTIAFIALDLIFLFLSSFVVVGDGHKALMGG